MTNKNIVLNLLIEKRNLSKELFELKKMSKKDISILLYDINKAIYVLDNNLWVEGFEYYNFNEDSDDYTYKQEAYEYVRSVFGMFFYLKKSLYNLNPKEVKIDKELVEKCMLKGFNKETEPYYYLLINYFIDINDDNPSVIMRKNKNKYILNSDEEQFNNYKKMLSVFNEINGSGNENLTLNEIKKITNVLE